ncbi:hepatic lectin-like isoform X1 [Aptenodytes patagonicus]|uniref:hepatic lectin-like isoform X1 n=1 Tax=Aptenodytes patagonicus TaxID=9234 RepID=UPI003FA17AAE
MDEEHLHDDLHVFKDRNFFRQKLRSFFTVYLLLALSFLLIITLFAVSLSRVFPCGPGSREWEYFDGKCYYFSLTRMSWYKAKAQCEEMHSRLAIINSYAKQNFVMFRTRNERFWIGLTDENSEGEWEWIDGTDYKTTFTFWKEGEPNNSGSNEDCAHIWVSGKWNDVYCTYECYYVCEKPLPN